MIQPTKDDYEPDYYENLVKGSKEIELLIDRNFPLLREIYDREFFQKVREQLEEMKKHDLSGPIHSVFVALQHDKENNFKYKKLDHLDEYLKLIIYHPSTRKKDINYLKSELKRETCINIWFEISILGNLLKQLKSSNITLYAPTRGGKNVEAEIILDVRPIYLETTVLGESRGDLNTRARMMKARKNVWSGSRNMEFDTNRVRLKLKDKSNQFSPKKPNVLILSFFDFFPVDFQINNAIRTNSNDNIGIIMKFKRELFSNFITHNLDQTCFLTKLEVRKLKDLLSGSDYEPLIY